MNKAMKRKLQILNWFQRIVMAVAVGMNIRSVFDVDLPTWLRIFQGAAVVALLALQVRLERSRRHADRVLEDLRWDIAAQSADPITTLARWDYFDTLSPEQHQELSEWLRKAKEVGYDELPPLDDLPPVVAGLFRIDMEQPKER